VQVNNHKIITGAIVNSNYLLDMIYFIL